MGGAPFGPFKHQVLAAASATPHSSPKNRYLDSSAFLKLLAEPETDAMRAWAASHAPVDSSQLLVTEVLRAASRLGIERSSWLAALDGVVLLAPGPATFYAAGEVAPPGLGSLDALRLASALELGPDLTGLVSYDQRLIGAAVAAGADVVTPTSG